MDMDMETNSTTNEVTDDHIAALRTEAYDAGDSEQASICDVALGLSPWSMTAQVANMSKRSARRICADVIYAAREAE